VADGLLTIEQAVAAVPEEQLHVPELLRLRGEPLLKTVEHSQSAADKRKTEEEAARYFREGSARAHEMGQRWSHRARPRSATGLRPPGRRAFRRG
jgi:hypothetical protein